MLLQKMKMGVLFAALCMSVPAIGADNPVIKIFKVIINNVSTINLERKGYSPEDPAHYLFGVPPTPAQPNQSVTYAYSVLPSASSLEGEAPGGYCGGLTPCVTYLLDNGARIAQGCQLFYWASATNDCMVKAKPVGMGPSGCPEQHTESPSVGGICEITLTVSQ